uniref:Immunoglobulin domain-containing protein n=1 Tax=Cyprinus carpio TaxID=7962 RepID=A0A8C1KNX2_CYPCA
MSEFLTVLHVFVVVTDAVKSVSVNEGETVTLPINEIQNDDLIQWMFGDIRLAEIHKADQRFFTYDGPDERFRDRLKLDHQTGSLIITNTRITDSRKYEVKINRSNRCVFADEVVSVTEGDSVTLNTSLTEIQKNDQILWKFGPNRSLIAKISQEAGIFNTYDGPDERFRGRLQLDNQTGSLIITDTRTTDSGLYEVTIKNSRSEAKHRFNVTVYGE